ncbi:MAG: hypothetical protein PVF45_14395 [Anaerolineae bacterium]|jgi:hypothetical protein
MKNYGRTSVYEFLGDRIVYRNLVPADPRLPPLAETSSQVGIAPGVTPRKSAPEYARVIVHLLRQARGGPIERLLYLGDTRLNDGTAFANIRRAGDWTGLAFIGAERDEPAQVEVVQQGDETLYLANRWAALHDLDQFCREQAFPIDERTAVIVDLDKTALGARGRNDHVIDQARVEAVRRTVGDLLGDDFDAAGFQRAYDCLNQTEFHPFTTDNQDYLAYVCLILGSGLYQLTPLVDEVRAGKLKSFAQFIADVNAHAGELPANLREIHDDVYAYVQQGDPTPFKAFRYNEYHATIERMGSAEDDEPVAGLLQKNILITQELRAVALDWQARGALLFALSDKPDEASVPTDELAAQGYQPIHRTQTYAVGR